MNIAREYRLIIFSDEIYDKILYDDAQHIPMGSLADDILIVTFNGLSKSYRAAGFRAGWMILSGNKKIAADYIEGLDILSNMRLCSNVPAQLEYRQPWVDTRVSKILSLLVEDSGHNGFFL